jgi:hypothetical protein
MVLYDSKIVLQIRSQKFPTIVARTTHVAITSRFAIIDPLTKATSLTQHKKQRFWQHNPNAIPSEANSNINEIL